MSIDVMSLIIFISGMFILIYGIFFSPTEEEEEILTSSLDTKEFEKFFGKMQEKINDADKMMVELDKFTQHVTSDMEEKYKELMMLYQLIDEKYQNVSKEEDIIKKRSEEINKREQEMLVEERKKAEELRNSLEKKQVFQYEAPKNVQTYNMPIENKQIKQYYVGDRTNEEKQIAMGPNKTMFDEIVYLYENGRNIDEIAKALGKGKGEIRLMLDLMGKGE